MGFDILRDCLQPPQEEALPQLRLLERFSCPAELPALRVIYDQGTPIDFCTKG
jgi:hypothetical protein